MTALTEYDRLEATGLWRPSADARRQEVVVSIGDATLQLFDPNGTARAHWSLPAMERRNPGQMPALFGPADDAGEEVEIDDETMIEAIERVGDALSVSRPKEGWFRGRMTLALGIAVLVGFAIWLPGAMVRYASKTVPEITRSDIGLQLLAQIERIAGLPCRDAGGPSVLANLATRLDLPPTTQVLVFRAGLRDTAHLPGGPLLLASWILEDFESPQVPAGFILAEAERRSQQDPLADLLETSGIGATFRLLTTGALPESALERYAATLLTRDRAPVPDRRLLASFETAEVASSPYAYAVDVTGEQTVRLIEGDPFNGVPPRPVLSDDAWVALQGICGN